MSAVLGVSGHSHDAAAALFVDGELVAAAQEERFSRLKNDPSLPLRAIEACLHEVGLTAKELDEVVFYENPYLKLERVLQSSLRELPRSLRQIPRALAAQLGGKVWVLDALSQRLGVPRERVTYRDHHLSHAASAFLLSPYERAAVLTVDAVGEDVTTALWLGEGNQLKCLEWLTFPHSLGLLYSAVTAWLGFEVNEGEYKVMGLAAFGTPRFEADFRRLITVAEDGSFTLDLEYFAAHTQTDVGFSPSLERLLGPRRPVGRPWNLEQDEADRRYADVAASLQQTLERVVLGLAARVQAKTKATALCLAGGVALNAVANSKLAQSGLFEHVFVQPAAGDAGGALGAGALGATARSGRRPRPMAHAALGPSVSGDRALPLAKALGFEAEWVEAPELVAADAIAGGSIVAWAEGRMEFGPRALGQRSLLALPHPADVRERLNRVIKRREPFRPFAPAVLEPEATRWFSPTPVELSSFMTTVATVRPERRAHLAAITHVDGTARLQTVSPQTRFGRLITRLHQLTGVPMVLNTSLNGPQEPIVCSESDALAFFIAHPADVLFIDDVKVTRPCSP